ncbi:MAG: hypothetical protein LGR52_11870 [Candidatus Thiosymbion ectosymbiont of Robbea hypermnestra]|nr:hypothetical protein [Candidatus Thiosymbion ectosymbiont of Robbea hypermnestra]
MKTSLEHLPEQKRQELQRVIEIIREEIDLDMLILFGSYARGDWVEDLDPETLLYRSPPSHRASIRYYFIGIYSL